MKIKMRIYWKALIGYGFVFWLLLCITDFLGITNVHKYSKDLDELYEKPMVVKKIEEKFEPQLRQLEFKGIKFGWSLLVWNAVTFIFSIIVCTIGKTVGWMVWSYYRCYRNRILCLQLNTASSQCIRGPPSLSRIPVMVKSISRSSDSNLHNLDTKSKINVEKSCPNLSMTRSRSNLSSVTDITTKTTKTIFRKCLYLCDQPELSSEQLLEKQCRKLKEELHRLQTTSLKEHAVLSRKLESVNKERKDLSKQLVTAQKENRAAKQQLEELLEEKSSLVKKLENATKEFKCNTKTKKFALAKLEEVTNNVEELRIKAEGNTKGHNHNKVQERDVSLPDTTLPQEQQLEQVSRDKEILEKKLRLLEIEYNKLHERYIVSQQRYFTNNSNENLPERDENNDRIKYQFAQTSNFMDANNIPPALLQTADVLASVSQTELDMKKIQEKIRQLEKNLENLNITGNEFERSTSVHQLESDLSLSAIDPTSDSQVRMEDDSGTTLSGFSGTNSPRQRYWSEKVAELVGKNKSKFAKIHALAMQMQEKARFLGNIRERTENIDDINNTGETSDSEDREPKRMVSSSVAFKNFLKSLNKLDAAKHQFPSSSEVYF